LEGLGSDPDLVAAGGEQRLDRRRQLARNRIAVSGREGFLRARRRGDDDEREKEGGMRAQA